MNTKERAKLLLEAVKMIEAVRDADLDAAPHTYSAAEAWRKMEEGWVVNYSHLDTPPRCFMRGDGLARWGGMGICGRNEWLIGYKNTTFTLHGIHPKAHVHALQRHIAAGMKVGSRVEVVHWDTGQSLKTWRLDYSRPGKLGRVAEIDNDSPRIVYDDDCSGNSLWSAAHCLRLIEAEPEAEQPYTPPCDAPDGFEWAECEGYPRQGDRAWKSNLGFFTASLDWRGGKGKAHILRKLPKTWKPGDRVWVEVEVVTGEPDKDGELKVKLASSTDWTVYCPFSALRETPGGGE